MSEGRRARRADDEGAGEPAPRSHAPDRPLDAPATLLLRPEQCSVGVPGVVLMIRRAAVTLEHAVESCAAIEECARRSARGIVTLNVFRLCPDFPLQPGFDANVRDLASALRRIEPHVVASADVLEFGGMRAALMRAATRAVWALARPRAQQASVDRLSDAIEWLLPHAQAIGAPDDAGTYVRLFRHAQGELDELDARRALAR